MTDSANGKRADSRQRHVLGALDSIVSGKAVVEGLAKDELIQIAAAIRESRPQPSKKFSRRMERAIDKGVADHRNCRSGIKLGLCEWLGALGTQRLAVAGAACVALVFSASALAILRHEGERDSQSQQASVKKNHSPEPAIVAKHSRVTKSRKQREKSDRKRNVLSQTAVAQNLSSNGSPDGQGNGKWQQKPVRRDKKKTKPKSNKKHAKVGLPVATPIPGKMKAKPRDTKGAPNASQPTAAPTDPIGPGPPQTMHTPAGDSPSPNQ